MKQPHTDFQNPPKEWIIILDTTLLSKIGYTNCNKHEYQRGVFTDTANYPSIFIVPLLQIDI